MNFKKLTDQAKAAIDKRGGTEALKGDLAGLKDVAKGKGTFKEKAQAAKDRLKQPGARTDAADTPGVATPGTADAPGTTPGSVPPPGTVTTPGTVDAPPTSTDLPPRG